jgi:hypothetical protein
MNRRFATTSWFSRFAGGILAAIAVLTSLSPAGAGAPSLLEVIEHGKKHEGKLQAKSANSCWLMGRDGRLAEVPIKGIDSIRTIGARFRQYSLAELRDQLRREVPKTMRVDGSGHFLICAERNSRQLGAICEETYRTFYRYFSVRGFRISEPEFPLVVIVFPDQARFLEYCRKDGLTPPNGLLGYYMRLTNRIALFDVPRPVTAGRTAGPTITQDAVRTGDFTSVFGRREEDECDQVFRGPLADPAMSVRFDAIVQGNLHDTIVHETTHQVAFNTGLHSRLAETPKWVIEGLATMFEAPGIRDSQKNAGPKSRINRDRFVWFMNYLKSRRQSRSLEDFISKDDLYTSATLDAYSEGWALTFFLAETRHGSYVRFLKAIAKREGLKAYLPEQRVADFRKAFGDLKSVEADYVRFFEKMK